MENKTFIIKYKIVLISGQEIKDKEMKVKNCYNGVAAQVKLEKYLQKKHEEFKQLIVSSCKEDPMSAFGTMFGTKGNPFGDIFAGGNPFG